MMQQTFQFIKRIISKRTLLYKGFIAFFIISFFMTYIGFALHHQDTVLPDNPLTEIAENSSKIPLMGGDKNLVHAEEMEAEEAEKEENNNEQEEQTKKDKQDLTNKEKQTNQTEQNEQRNETETEVKDENKKGTANNDENETGINDGEGSGGNRETTSDASNKEITDGEPATDEVNEYFIISIEDGEIVTEQEYSFYIEQLEHRLTVKDIQVFIKQGEVNNISSDLSRPVYADLTLAKGKNDVRVGVTYQDDTGQIFTVSRSYLIIFDEENIVIKTNLKDGVTKKQTLTFNASAQLRGETAPLEVIVNEEKVSEEEDRKYVVDLKTGKNTIILESNYKGLKAKQTYEIEYKEPKLHIETDLKDQAVEIANFRFTAKAFDDSEQVDLFVVQDDDELVSDKGSYDTTLIEGENIFTLTAKRNSVTYEEVYVVIYSPKQQSDPREDENEEDNGGTDDDDKGEQNKHAPTIEVHDIADGATIKSASHLFHVKAYNYAGKSLTAGNGKVSAKNNGASLKINWSDSSQISFDLDVQSGENNIVITATDNEGNTATKQLTVYGDIVDGVIGTAQISVEATTIGLGYIIAPEQVEIYQGENGAHVIDRLFDKHGINYDYTGSHKHSFYLAAIYKSGLITNPVIPADLAELVERDMERFDPADYNSVDSLGEFDFTNGSGWMYSVNGNYPNVGFADYKFKDGDVVRIRFTLAYGADIGGGAPGTNYHKQW
ncbi:DUF4430 domain-containing protein [Pseudogracilibacillus auburnensis]|uniref:DUF4430 domain-containing protein n=1 Tax=Pseudogracilibacillus auburnensis TaxID=1494959 RepID=UPI001A974DA8|nr:DUF4430 domain-containing protein [Pseudogracilibacillus auburnensis]MBO1005552.1 DUF4430 domain-containing protein [Pseudogracilibacillus auburnensis]